MYWKYSYIFCMLSWFTSVENGFFCLQIGTACCVWPLSLNWQFVNKAKIQWPKDKTKDKIAYVRCFSWQKRNEIEQKKFSHQPNVVRCVNVINRRNKSDWWSRIATIITIRLGDSNNFPRNLQNMWMKKRKKKTTRDEREFSRNVALL